MSCCQKLTRSGISQLRRHSRNNRSIESEIFKLILSLGMLFQPFLEAVPEDEADEEE